MKKLLATILLLPLALLPCRAQTNVIFGYLADMELANVAGVAVTMSAVDQNPTLRNGIWVSKQPKTHFTDAAGRWAFTNVPFGQIEIDAQGQFLTGFINPNTTGLVNFSTLATNVYNLTIGGSSGSGTPLAAGTNTSVRTTGGTNYVDIPPNTFDAAGSASAAQSNAEAYADSAIAPWTNQVTGASIAAVGGLTNAGAFDPTNSAANALTAAKSYAATNPVTAAQLPSIPANLTTNFTATVQGIVNGGLTTAALMTVVTNGDYYTVSGGGDSIAFGKFYRSGAANYTNSASATQQIVRWGRRLDLPTPSRAVTLRLQP
jgi:hypothetical protein